MQNLIAVALCALALSSCGGDGGNGGAVIVVVTPVGGGANATPTVDPALPIETPEMLTSAVQIYQSGAVLVSVTGSVASGSVTFLNRTFPLTKGSQSMYAFVPTDTEDPTGAHELRANFVLTNGTKGSTTETVTVLKTRWTTDSLTFTERQTEAYLDPTVEANELAQMKAVYAKVTPQKLWAGGWLLPLDGPVTARFGEQRSVNGSEPSGHHGGTDLGVPEGRPVAATNSGKVVMAKALQIHGNTVIIDHGGGVFSGYSHLQELQVGEGQTVAQGDIIGLSGNTGRSTGAHLHWEISVGGILVDALRFTDGTNGF